MSSAQSKWNASANAWNRSKDYNLGQINKNFSDNALIQALQDATNAYYAQGNGDKYYFRHPDAAGEYDTIINNFTNTQKQGLQNALTNASTLYDPTYGGGFGNNFADQYVNEFLTGKYNDALEQLDRAKSRGTLNDVGYNRAVQDLATQRSAANSTLGSLGRSLVSDYNTGMQTGIENYQNLLNDYNLANDYSRLNTDIVNTKLSDMYNNYLSGFEGDFNAAMAGQEPFDVSGILGSAKVAQGVTNPQSNALIDAISDQNSKKKQKVGLGNEGVF